MSLWFWLLTLTVTMKPWSLQSLASNGFSPRFNTLLGFGCHRHKHSHPDVILIHTNQKTFFSKQIWKGNLWLYVSTCVNINCYLEDTPSISHRTVSEIVLQSWRDGRPLNWGAEDFCTAKELHPSSNFNFSLQSRHQTVDRSEVPVPELLHPILHSAEDATRW